MYPLVTDALYLHFRIIYDQVFCGGRRITEDPEACHGGWRHVPVRRVQ